jgi:hypothetical protein
LKMSSSAGSALLASTSIIQHGNCVFGTCAVAHQQATGMARIRATSSYKVTGGALWHLYIDEASTGLVYNITLTLTGTPAFGSRFLQVSTGSTMTFQSVTVSGSATGTRYYASGLSLIATAGGGASYIPGNAAGSTDASSIYS